AGPDPATAAAIARCRSDPTADDFRLTVAAMKALAADPRLAPLNLGLTVHDHRITLWGFVPSLELAQLAEKRLLNVPGIGQVLNQLQVQAPADGSPSSGSTPPPRTSPIGVPASDGPLPPARAPLQLPIRNETDLADLRPARGVLPPMRVVARPVMTTEPPLTEPPPVARPAPSATELAVANAMRGDIRYQRLRADVRGNVVSLHGSVFSWDDLRLLATSLSRLPGIQRVLLDNVRVTR
ncbi:MAG TPA: BON domain-containing protein, partial [Gemmataceae bacterium]|nr:BON domain-containing protein [Gemmataceae bacterium]